VAILSGVQDGDMAVTSGQMKLKNGSPVVINTRVLPANEENPKPDDE
jgi:membrane fusion protein (multidrug efflux system)